MGENGTYKNAQEGESRNYKLVNRREFVRRLIEDMKSRDMSVSERAEYRRMLDEMHLNSNSLDSILDRLAKDLGFKLKD